MKAMAQVLGALVIVFLFWLAVFGADSNPSGAALYEKNCVSCHAADGTGKTTARKKMTIPNLLDKQFVEMSDKDMFETIARGKDHREYPHTYLYMGMNEQQIQDVVGHIRKLQKK